MASVGLLRIGHKSEGVIHHSETRWWKVQALGEVKGKIYSLETVSSIEPNKTAAIGKAFVIQNVGNRTGTVYVKVAEIDGNGNVKDLFCDKSITLEPNQCAYVIADQDSRYTDIGSCDCEACKTIGAIRTKKPPGTYYFAVKVWGADESEPPWPSPAAAMVTEGDEGGGATILSEKWCLPATPLTPEVCLEPWQWGLLIGGSVVAGAGIGYILSKVWK